MKKMKADFKEALNEVNELHRSGEIDGTKTVVADQDDCFIVVTGSEISVETEKSLDLMEENWKLSDDDIVIYFEEHNDKLHFGLDDIDVITFKPVSKNPKVDEFDYGYLKISDDCVVAYDQEVDEIEMNDDDVGILFFYSNGCLVFSWDV